MRKRRAVKRDVLPDPIYNSKLVTKLINSLMLDGKKGVAQIQWKFSLKLWKILNQH